MTEARERIIYSNYFSQDDYEYAEESVKERHLEEFPDDKEYEPTESEIWDEYYFLQDMTWDDEECNLKKFFNNGTFILQGSIGCWNGRYGGGFVFDSFNELCRVWNDCDYVKLYDENGHFFIKCSHHDGTNLFEVRELNDKGYEYYSNRYYCDDTRRVHNRLMTSKYSRLPHYAHKVYGCKKREMI